MALDVPKHPLADIGGYSMPKTGKIGGQQSKVVRDKAPSHKVQPDLPSPI